MATPAGTAGARNASACCSRARAWRKSDPGGDACRKSGVPRTTRLRWIAAPQFCFAKNRVATPAKRHDGINLQVRSAKLLNPCAKCYESVAIRAILAIQG